MGWHGILAVDNMEQDKVTKLMNAYARAFDKLDPDGQADLFADAFIMAGPKGAVSPSRDEFLKNAAKAGAFYKSVGHTGASIISLELALISNDYTMAKVHWGVTFEKTGDQPVEFDVSYIVHSSLPEPKIIMAITHEDEQEAMNKLGILNQN